MHPRLRIPSILHLAIASGLGLVLVVFYMIGNAPLEGAAPGAGEMDPELFLPIAFLLALGGSVASHFLPNIIAAQATAGIEGTADYKPLDADEIARYVAIYQNVKIVQWALLDGPGIFCAVVFFLTGRIEALGVAGLMLLLLLFFRPSRGDFQKRFGLSDQQLQEF